MGREEPEDAAGSMQVACEAGHEGSLPPREMGVNVAYEYQNFEDDMILRDYLAYDRTKFALLRTFLSIFRTALGLLASGAGLVILQTSTTLVVLGYVLVGAALVVMVIGGVYSLRAKRRLDGLHV